MSIQIYFFSSKFTDPNSLYKPKFKNYCFRFFPLKKTLLGGKGGDWEASLVNKMPALQVREPELDS